MDRAAGAAEVESEMVVIHICSLMFILYPVYEDIRTQKIRIFPGLCLIAAGVLARAAVGGYIRRRLASWRTAGSSQLFDRQIVWGLYRRRR